MQYVDFMCKNYVLPDSEILLFTSIYNYITQDIDNKLADILGKIPLEIYGSEKQKNEFAPKINLFESIIYCITHKPIKKYKCLKISIARSNILVRLIMQYALTHKALRKEVINININVKKRKFLITLLGISFGYNKNKDI
jgi:hypothetical protein